MQKVVAAVALCFIGCGGVTTSKQDNSTPQGQVEGRVLDAATGEPISGVNISTFAQSRVETTTDENGRYALGPLPAGSYTVIATADGFVRRIFTGVGVSGAAGNYPTANTVSTRDFDMARGDAKIDGAVITSSTTPAKGATVYIDLRGNGFDLVQTAQCDNSGKFSFSGLPGAAAGQTITVNAAPYDENQDGIPDFASNSRSYTLFPGGTATGPITVNAASLTVLSNNVADGDLGPTEPIVLTFASTMRPSQSTFTVTRNSNGLQVGLGVSWDSTNTTVTLTPAGGNLVEGSNYTLSWNVRATSSAQTSNSVGFVVRSTTTTMPGNVQNLRVLAPANGMYDSTQSTITVGWDVASAASGYRVYAKDQIQNPAYVLIQTINNNAVTSQGISLSSYFGVSSGMGALAYGNKVTVAVVALDRGANEGPLASAPTLDFTDNVAPTVGSAFISQGSLNNSGGSSASMATLRVNFNEAMSSMAPTLMAPAQVTSTFRWSDANNTIGLYTLTIPASVNGSGTYSVSGAKDSSGNTMAMSYSVNL